MKQLDFLIYNSLSALAGDYADNAADNNCPEVIPFGQVAFIKESSWQTALWYRSSSTDKRSSHPGLSISSEKNQVAFGSSGLADRDIRKTLFVAPSDCPVLKQKTAFLLQYSAPVNIYAIDFRKSTTANLTDRLIKELQRKLTDAGV